MKLIYLINLDTFLEVEINVKNGETVDVVISGIKLGPALVLGAL